MYSAGSHGADGAPRPLCTGDAAASPLTRGKFSEQWNAVARKGDVCGLLSLAAERNRQGCTLTQRDLTVLLKTARGYGSPAQLAEALGWAACLRGEADSILLQELLCAYRRLGRVEDAVRVFGAAKRNGSALTCFHYTTMVALCADLGDARRAESYLQELRARGDRPDAMLYATLINAYGRADLPEEAQRLFDEHQEVRSSAGASSGDARPNGPPAPRPGELRSETAKHGALLLALCRAGYIERASALAAAADAAGIPLELAPRGALLKAYLRAGQPAQAETLYAWMSARGLKVERALPRLLIHGYGRKGLVQDAERIFRSIHAAGDLPDEAEYGAFLHALARAGRTAQVEAVIGEMRAAGLQPNHIHLGILVDSHARAGDLLQAEASFGAMQRAGHQPSRAEYGTLLTGYCRAACLTGAESVVERMRAAGVPLDGGHLCSLALAYERAGQLERARALRSQHPEVLRNRIRPGPEERSTELT